MPTCTDGLWKQEVTEKIATPSRLQMHPKDGRLACKTIDGILWFSYCMILRADSEFLVVHMDVCH